MLSFALISGSIEQGLAYGIMALGVFITYRVLQFADLTVDGTFPLGAAVAASLIVSGTSPFVACVVAMLAGMLGGALTGFLHTKLRIAGLLAGILTMTGLYQSICGLRAGRTSRCCDNRRSSPYWKSCCPRFSIYVVGAVASGQSLSCSWTLSWPPISDWQCEPRETVGDDRSLGVDTEAMTIAGLSLANGLVALSGLWWLNTRVLLTGHESVRLLWAWRQ